MSHNLLFLALGKDPDVLVGIPMEQVRHAFKALGIDLPHLHEGANSMFVDSGETARYRIHEEMDIDVKGGEVSSLSIFRPCSPAPGSQHFWYALLELGFVMVTQWDGAFYVSARTAREVRYLDNGSGGLHVVTGPGQFSF